VAGLGLSPGLEMMYCTLGAASNFLYYKCRNILELSEKKVGQGYLEISFKNYKSFFVE
jgi:hypothetical protein